MVLVRRRRLLFAYLTFAAVASVMSAIRSREWRSESDSFACAHDYALFLSEGKQHESKHNPGKKEGAPWIGEDYNEV